MSHAVWSQEIYEERARNRLWTKFNIGNEDECWPWKLPIKEDNWAGPTFFFRGWGMRSASRIFWYLLTGQELPFDVYVCHHCDNRICMNPIHFFLGTAKDNSQDMISKGRGKGAHSYCSKGHLLSGSNVKYLTNRRICVQCSKDYTLNYYRNKNV